MKHLVKMYLINGERVLSLLSMREALGKPTGAAAFAGGAIRYPFANPALNLNSREISYVRNSGYRAAPDETFGVPAVLQKHILSRRFVALAQRRWPQNISCPHQLLFARFW